MNVNFQRILEYEDVFQDEPIDIEYTLKKYNREIIIRFICVLGHSFGNAFLRSSTFFSSISNKHIQYLNKKVTHALKKIGVDDICYSTLKTSLELLRITFSIPSIEYSNIGLKEDFEYDMFRVVLKLNQKVFSFKCADTLKLDELVYFNQFATNDTNNLSIDSVFQVQCYYSYELFSFLEQFHSNILSDLLRHWNISNYNHYLITIYSIYLLCLKQQQKTPKGYWLLDFDKIQIQEGLLCPQVINNLSIDINEIIPSANENIKQRTDNIDYRTFRSRPLIRLSDNKYYVYNLQLLIERTYNSLFFDLKSVWKGNGFTNFFNTQFVEYYLFRHAMKLCSNKKDYTYPTKQMLDNQVTKEAPNQPDFYIRRQESLILFECKAFKLNGGLKDKADVQNFFRELKLKLYEATENIDKTRKNKNKPEPVGVTQLVSEIEKIEDYDFPFDKMIPEKVEYYPIIVLEDSRFVQPGLMSIVNRWSKKLLAEKIGTTAYYPIIITSIDVLYFYRDTFRKIGFPEIINKFLQSNARLNDNKVDWEISPMADFNTFVKNKYRRSMEKGKHLPYDKNFLSNIGICVGLVDGRKRQA